MPDQVNLFAGQQAMALSGGGNAGKGRTGLPRPVEAVLAFFALIIVTPFLALPMVVVALTSPGPLLFRQKRVGRNGRHFVMYKLRSMRLSSEGPQVTAGDDARVTRVGKVLRKTKLDEIPELWNVLKGDMSLVGPRPEVPRYVDPQNAMWRLVLQARPGLTDPVTLRLRNEETLLAEVKGDREHFYVAALQPFKLKGYLDYLEGRSWWSDMKVLWKTCLAVLLSSRAIPPTLSEVLASVDASVASGAMSSSAELSFVFANGVASAMTLPQRRKAQRLKVGWDVKVKGTDSSGLSFDEVGALENLSSSGAFVYLKTQLKRGAHLDVWIRVPSEVEPHQQRTNGWSRCSAEVVRVESASQKVGIAMKFGENLAYVCNLVNRFQGNMAT